MGREGGALHLSGNSLTVLSWDAERAERAGAVVP